MHLIQLLNPSHEPRAEAAMYQTAQGNSFITVLGLFVTILLMGFGFGDSLVPERLTLWIVLMSGALLLGWRAHRALHPSPPEASPSPANLRLWRKRQTVAFIVEGLGWGALGLLFQPNTPLINALLLTIYIAAGSAGGHASGVHSHRLFLVAIAASWLVMLPCLFTGFGDLGWLLAGIVVVYCLFLAKVSYSSHKTLLRTVALQVENEQLLQERAIAMQQTERERIYRDLHDDVGAKLLGLAISAQRTNQPRQADLARSALQDLRDVVSRSSHAAAPLSDLLADWRAETMQRVHAAELALDWHFPAHDSDIAVNPEAALHLSRILREAVSNVLRHAQASHIRIATWLDEKHFSFSVEDNGIGLPQQAAPRRGMSSMQARAATLGAALDWQPLEPGCRVAFTMPLAALTP